MDASRCRMKRGDGLSENFQRNSNSQRNFEFWIYKFQEKIVCVLRRCDCSTTASLGLEHLPLQGRRRSTGMVRACDKLAANRVFFFGGSPSRHMSANRAEWATPKDPMGELWTRIPEVQFVGFSVRRLFAWVRVRACECGLLSFLEGLVTLRLYPMLGLAVKNVFFRHHKPNNEVEKYLSVLWQLRPSAVVRPTIRALSMSGVRNFAHLPFRVCKLYPAPYFCTKWLVATVWPQILKYLGCSKQSECSHPGILNFWKISIVEGLWFFTNGFSNSNFFRTI